MCWLTVSDLNLLTCNSDHLSNATTFILQHKKVQNL